MFLRQYEFNAAGDPVATGKLIEGGNGGMATWAELKAQARDILGIQLTDTTSATFRCCRTDPYGNFIPGAERLPAGDHGIGADGVPKTADDIVI